MRNYKIELIASGALTQLPDSQKLFGALVYMFSEKYGNERTTALVKAVLDKKIHLALSNLMPAGYFPNPQDYWIDMIGNTVGSDIGMNAKEKRTAIKERSYMKPEDLECALSNPNKCAAIYPYIKLQTQPQLRASIESNYHGIPGLDTKLYSVPTVSLLEIHRAKDQTLQKKIINTFCFYLQVDTPNSVADLLDMLNAAAQKKETMILGKRASQGLNTFQMVHMAEEDVPPPAPKKLYLNMGMLLPHEINFTASTLKIFTSERRPFVMTGGWEKNTTKHYLSFIAEGSIISVPKGLLYAGKSIVSPFNPTRDIVFGNSFLYPIL